MILNLKQECLNIYKNLPKEIQDKSIKIELDRGEVLYQKGQEPKSFFFIKEGLMALTDLSPNGNESLLRVHGENFFIGHRSFIVQENYHANAIALESTVLLRMPFIDVNDVLLNHPFLFKHLTQMIGRDLRMAEERINDLTGKRVKSRIIDTLLFLKKRDPDYPWTRREIGDFCGAKTETVTRVLGELEKKSLLLKNGREITIPDFEKLIDYKIESELES